MKSIILFSGFLLVGSCLFGQNFFSNYSANYPGDNVFTNYSLTLSPFADSRAIKADDRKWPAFALNLVLGMGIGSFVQGDALGGLVGLFGELGGMTLFIIGIVPEIELVYHEEGNSYYSISYPNIALFYVGTGVLLGTRVFEMIRPFAYANSFSIAFTPGFDVNGQPALTAMVKCKL
jgi:hypothetical protein